MQNNMKMSQYNWNWWFVISTIICLMAMLLTMVAESQQQYTIAAFVWVIAASSMLPCLYVGMKPMDK